MSSLSWRKTPNGTRKDRSNRRQRSHTHHHLAVWVFIEKCFVSSQQIWPGLTSWLCCNCGMNVSATVTNHYFLLFKLNFDACNQFGLSVYVIHESECFSCSTFEKNVFTAWEQIRGREIWQICLNAIRVSQHFPCVRVHLLYNRCVSCLSTRWKCYWDLENHLCVSNKDESKHNLLEVSNPSPPRCFNPSTKQTPEDNIKIPPVRASDIIQTLLSNKCAVMISSPDGLGKSNHVVIQHEVSSASNTVCRNVETAIKSQEVLV